MQHIVICSEDARFSAALAEIITAELGVLVTKLERVEQLKAALDKVDLVISNSSVREFWQGKQLLYPKAKPQKIHALIANIRTQLTQKNTTKQVISDKILLDTASRSLQHMDTGATLELTEKEQVLLLFIKVAGAANREDILRGVWGVSPDIDTHTLETHLYRLRQKWRELVDFDCIVATDGGYRWYE